MNATHLVIAATARLHPGAVLGPFVEVGEHVTLESGVTVDGHVRLPPGLTAARDARIGAGAVFEAGAPIRLEAACRVGAGAVIAAGVVVGAGAVVAPGAVVLRPVQPFAEVAGNPAAVCGFASTVPPVRAVAAASDGGYSVRGTTVRGVTVHTMPFFHDPRGDLTVGEFGRHLPFQPRRYFITFDVPNASLRGEHAHRRCAQFLICVRGSCAVVADDGRNREEFLLDRPVVGVHVPPMVWATEYKHSPDSTLMVFASDFYDPDDYIRDYQEFLRLAESREDGACREG